jgi:hypothetical protein
MNGPLTPQKAESRFYELLSGKSTNRTCWAIIEKETSAFAGHAFLFLDNRHPIHELGFLFFKSFWDAVSQPRPPVDWSDIASTMPVCPGFWKR